MDEQTLQMIEAAAEQHDFLPLDFLDEMEEDDEDDT